MSSTNPKTFSLPSESEMRLRLQTVSDEPYLAEKLYPLLLRHAGQELTATGLVLAVQGALLDYAQGRPPIMSGIIQMYLNPIVVALVDDEDIKAEALNDIAETEAELQQKLALMRQIKHLARVYDECVTDKWNQSEAYRKGGVNPFHHQTESGLFLEFSYGYPSKVWTPWGYWYFAAAQPSEAELNAFMARLTVRLHSPVKELTSGFYGPVYAILAIDGEALPEPVLLTDQRQYTDEDIADAEWQRLFAIC